MKIIYLHLIVAVAIIASSPLFAAPSRFDLADQSNWGANRGFYIDLENDTSDDGNSLLATLKLVGAAADGKNWRYIITTPSWKFNHTYTAVLSVDGAHSTLTLDGTVISETQGPFTPNAGPVAGDTIPAWANAPTNYQIEQTSLDIQEGSRTYSAALPPNEGAASLFGSAVSASLYKWTYDGKPFTVTVAFRIDAPTEASAYLPLVDEYGQPTFADYVGKVKSDFDLSGRIAPEKEHEAPWNSSRPFNQYGGQLHPDWREKATGFYHVTRRNNFWWLIDPTGSPLYYTGVCNANIPNWEATPVTGRESIFSWIPSNTNGFSPAVAENAWGSDPGIEYVSFGTANLMRKYGADWKPLATKVETRRVRSWGFSGLGKWTTAGGSTPSIPVLNFGAVPNLVRHPDIFDPQIKSTIVASLTAQIAPYAKSPLVVGWSFGNEYDEVITTDEIRQILAKPAANPSRMSLLDFAAREMYQDDAAKAADISNMSDDDIEKLRQYYADQYYAFVHDTIKAIDPNHLFLGFWLVPNWWQNVSDWKLQENHVDVLGIDYYNRSFDDPVLLNLIRGSDKPVLIGEFSFPPTYKGLRGFGNYQSASTTNGEAGQLYDQWISATASNPNVIGACWFQMRDEPITGRGPGSGPNVVYGEHYAFGLVDVTDTPKWDLVDKVHSANVQAAIRRDKASSGR